MTCASLILSYTSLSKVFFNCNFLMQKNWLLETSVDFLIIFLCILMSFFCICSCFLQLSCYLFTVWWQILDKRLLDYRGMKWRISSFISLTSHSMIVKHKPEQLLFNFGIFVYFTRSIENTFSLVYNHFYIFHATNTSWAFDYKNSLYV